MPHFLKCKVNSRSTQLFKGQKVLNKELAEKVLRHAQSTGADFAEIFVEDSFSSSISLEESLVEQASDYISRGAGVRVVFGDTTGFAHTTNLTESGLIKAAETARSVSKSGRDGSRRTVPLKDRVSSVPEARYDPSYFKSKAVEKLLLMDEVARSYDASISQVASQMSISARHIALFNSDGLSVVQSTFRSRAAIRTVAKGDTGLQSGYEPVGYSIDFDQFLEMMDFEALAKEATERAVRKLLAMPAPSGRLPVVIKRGSGGILFHEACGHGLEADHIKKNTSVYANRLGQKVASPLVTLVDDGTVEKTWGSFAYDDEGEAGRRNVLIKDGVLEDYMWDSNSAKFFNRKSSGNGRRQSYQHLPMVRMTNTYLLPGDSDPEEIVANTENGIYVARLSGGQVNTATGDFVFGTQEAYLIENGRITAPIRDTQLIGNGPEILAEIDMVGNDFDMTPGTCGKNGQSVPVGTGQPTLRVASITLGGTANA